jgi:hypothetical protein
MAGAVVTPGRGDPHRSAPPDGQPRIARCPPWPCSAIWPAWSPIPASTTCWRRSPRPRCGRVPRARALHAQGCSWEEWQREVACRTTRLARRLLAAHVPLLAGADTGNLGTFRATPCTKGARAMVEAGCRPDRPRLRHHRGGALPRCRGASLSARQSAGADGSPIADIRNTRRLRLVINLGRVVARNRRRQRRVPVSLLPSGGTMTCGACPRRWSPPAPTAGARGAGPRQPRARTTPADDPATMTSPGAGLPAPPGCRPRPR